MKWTCCLRSFASSSSLSSSSSSWQDALMRFQRDSLSENHGLVLLSEWTRVLETIWSVPSTGSMHWKKLTDTHDQVSTHVLKDIRTAVKDCVIAARLDALVLQSSSQYAGVHKPLIQAPLTQMRIVYDSVKPSERNTQETLVSSSKELQNVLTLLWSVELHSALLRLDVDAGKEDLREGIYRVHAEWILSCMSNCAFYFPRYGCKEDWPDKSGLHGLSGSDEDGVLKEEYNDLRSSLGTTMTPFEASVAMCTASTLTAERLLAEGFFSSTKDSRLRAFQERALVTVACFLLQRVAFFVDAAASEHVGSGSQSIHGEAVKTNGSESGLPTPRDRAVSKLAKYMQQSRLPPESTGRIDAVVPRRPNESVSKLATMTILSIRNGATTPNGNSKPQHAAKDVLQTHLEKCAFQVNQLVARWTCAYKSEELRAMITSLDTFAHPNGCEGNARLSTLLTTRDFEETTETSISSEGEKSSHIKNTLPSNLHVEMLRASFVNGLRFFEAKSEGFSSSRESGGSAFSDSVSCFGLHVNHASETTSQIGSDEQRRIDNLFPSHSRSASRSPPSNENHRSNAEELSDEDVERINAQLNAVARGRL